MLSIRTSLPVAFFAATLLFAVPSLGQEAAETSEEQVELNDEALEAMNDENYVRAASLLEESLHLGALNVTYLNLGRAYQKLGRCRDARTALSKVGDAPQVASPPPELVEKKAAQYADEVERTCDDDASGPRDGESDVRPPDEGDGSRARPNTPAIIVTSAGAGFLIAAAAFEWNAIRIRDEISDADTDGDGVSDGRTRADALELDRKADLSDTLALSTAIVGGALVGTGVYLFLRSPEAQSSVLVSPGPTSVSVSWKLRF